MKITRQLFAREVTGCSSESIQKAMREVKNPHEMCTKIAEMTEEFVDIIKSKLVDSQLAGSILYHRVSVRGWMTETTHELRSYGLALSQ